MPLKNQPHIYHIILLKPFLDRAGPNTSVNMPDVPGCSVPGCHSFSRQQTPLKHHSSSFHTLSRHRRDEWLKFIYKDRAIPSVLSLALRVCSSHFTDDCFTNLAQFNSGFAKRRMLKPGAVPTIYPVGAESSDSGVLPGKLKHLSVQIKDL